METRYIVGIEIDHVIRYIATVEDNGSFAMTESNLLAKNFNSFSKAEKIKNTLNDLKIDDDLKYEVYKLSISTEIVKE